MTTPSGTRAVAFAATIAFGLAGLSAACAGARGGLEGDIYRGEAGAFRIAPIPAGWRRISVPPAALAFHDDAHDASVLVNARCRAELDTPLVALTNQLIMGTTDREIATQETIPFDGREALHTRMRAKLDGVPMAYDIYVLKKDGCVYDFVYVAPPDRIDDGAPAFDRFVAPFHTITTPPSAVGAPAGAT